MPLGIERINARRKQPNDRIAFIKPLEGPDKALAEDFLERIAAICNPIMREHHLSVMSLEEYEPNLEFVGRNFNAGEVVQLVLKAPYTGHWLPFKYVQMVMMHELAHCKQMNHSGAFWKVRNAYAGELKTLWGRGYTGEGMWSRGITLVSGQYESDGLGANEVMPEHLCGGTFKSSGKRKRKAKEKTTYKEREARRVVKKFGKDGTALGADEETKSRLENGKRTAAKPRVAGSARGRELRAAAALARFKTRDEERIEQDEDEAGSETASDDDDDVPAVDINGKKLLDKNGRGMVKVCDDEDNCDTDAQNEMTELRGFDMKEWASSRKAPAPNSIDSSSAAPKTANPLDTNASSKPKAPASSHVRQQGRNPLDQGSLRSSSLERAPQEPANDSPTTVCQACSMGNDPAASTCVTCANVLDLARVPRIWRCQSETCRGGEYVNAGDCGVCGVCGARKGLQMRI